MSGTYSETVLATAVQVKEIVRTELGVPASIGDAVVAEEFLDLVNDHERMCSLFGKIGAGLGVELVPPFPRQCLSLAEAARYIADQVWAAQADH
jgi:hypothetical protein